MLYFGDLLPSLCNSNSYDTPERPGSSSVFDESSSSTAMGYLDATSGGGGGGGRGADVTDNAMCSELRPVGTSCSLLQLKSEPMVPSSPESTSDQMMCGGGGGGGGGTGGPDDCAGCGRLIQVKGITS